LLTKEIKREINFSWILFDHERAIDRLKVSRKGAKKAKMQSKVLSGFAHFASLREIY
jgi:hypothetical protein